MNKQIADSIAVALNQQITGEEILSLLEKPKSLELGDVAFPCFTLAKVWKNLHKVSLQI